MVDEHSPEGTAELSPGRSPTSVTLFWGVFLQTSHKIVILSEAPHRFIAWYSAGRGVEEPVLSVAEGTPRGACSTHAVGTLSTTEARTWRTGHGSKIRHRLGDGR